MRLHACRTVTPPRSACPNLNALLAAWQAKLVLALVRDLPTTTQVGGALLPQSSALGGLKGACHACKRTQRLHFSS